MRGRCVIGWTLEDGELIVKTHTWDRKLGPDALVPSALSACIVGPWGLVGNLHLCALHLARSVHFWMFFMGVIL